MEMNEVLEVVQVLLKIIQVLIVPLVAYIAWAFRSLGTRIAAVETTATRLQQKADDRDQKCADHNASIIKLFDKMDDVAANTHRILGLLEANPPGTARKSGGK